MSSALPALRVPRDAAGRARRAAAAARAVPARDAKMYYDKKPSEQFSDNLQAGDVSLEPRKAVDPHS